MEIINSLSKIVKPLRGIIFDMDGVTFDTMNHTYNWQKSVYDKLGDKTKEFLPYSDDWMENYNKIYKEIGMKGLYNKIAHVDFLANESQIWEMYDVYNKKNMAPTIVKNNIDMADVVREIYKNGKPNSIRTSRLRLGINTTKGFGSLESWLENAGIRECFDTIITYDNILRCLVDGKAKQENITINNIDILRDLVPKKLKGYMDKPNSLSSMLTVNSMGVAPHELFVLEDTENGILAYKPMLNSSGFTSAYVVGVTWGFVKDKQKLINAGADAIIDSPAEIIPLVENLGAFI